jgi:hypothetical protein
MINKRSNLETALRKAEKQLAHKRDLLRNHAPGTGWHIRFRREIASIEQRIADLKARLAQV